MARRTVIWAKRRSEKRSLDLNHPFAEIADSPDRIAYRAIWLSYDPNDTSKRFLADIYKEKKDRDGYAENLRYLSIIYILSRGTALLSTTLCGAAKMAWGFSQNGFEYMDVPGISS